MAREYNNNLQASFGYGKGRRDGFYRTKRTLPMKFKYLLSLPVLQILASCSQTYQVPRAEELKGIDSRASVVSLVISGKNAISIPNGGRFVYALYNEKIKFHDVLYHWVRETPITSADYAFITENINQIKYNSRKHRLNSYMTKNVDPAGINCYVKIYPYGKHAIEILNCDNGINKTIFNTLRNHLCDKMQNENYELGASFLWKQEETFPRKQQ